MAESIGQVTHISGKAFAETGGQLRPLAQGDPIHTDDILVTKAGANLEIKFADNTLLSQGPDARMVVDSYAYDPNNADTSSMLFEMAQGSFRMVTGKVAEAHPGGVKVESPLATIGIRGTTTNHDIRPPGPDGAPGQELHGAESLTGGQSMLLEDGFGNVQIVTFSGGAADFAPGQPMGGVRYFTPEELDFFQATAPLVTMGDPPPDAGEEDAEGEGDAEEEGAEGEGDAEEEGAEEGLEGEGLEGEGEVIPPPVVEPDILPPSPVAVAPPSIVVTPATPPPPTDIPDPEDDQDDQVVVKETLDGDDTIIGGASNDILHGGAGNDSLVGKAGDDWLDGGTGNDTLDGGTGIDKLNGGEGSDWASFTSHGTAGGTVNLSTPPSPNPHSATGHASFGNDVTHLLDIENVVGSAGDDNANILRGGDGNDKLYGDAGNDILYGGEGKDTIYGGAGDDEINGGEGDDSLDGGSGDDVIYGGAGNDEIDGGSGEDWANYSRASGGVTLNLANGKTDDYKDGDGGTDTLQDIENVQGSGYADSITGNASGNEIHGGAGDDSIDGGNGPNAIYGGAGSDTIYAGYRTGNDTVDGGEGNDSIKGGDIDGNDTFNGGAGDDTIYGGAGNDTLDGGTGDDSILGGNTGEDWANYSSAEGGGVTVDLSAGTASARGSGDSGTDTLQDIENVQGSGYADKITGGNDNNHIIGGAGDDTLYGNAGDDTLAGGAGSDTLDGGTGEDWANYSSAEGGGATVDLSAGTASARGSGDSGTDTLQDIENVQGSGYADSITGNASGNEIHGGAGNDKLYGDAGMDTIHGDDGDDFIEGGVGDDDIIGGAGNDILDGGAGSDQFTFAEDGAGNADKIKDFDADEDKIALKQTYFNHLPTVQNLPSTKFHKGNTATNADHRIIYDSAAKKLYYDADGSGSGAQVTIATFENLTGTFDASDIIIF